MDGLLLVDKSAGMTSHDAVNIVREATHTRAVGHAGTLDPFATGLLILGIGKGTKSLTALVGLEKTYAATLELGATTNTFDREGERMEIVCEKPKMLDIEKALYLFRGGYEQKAPLFSAKKIRGKKLYMLARAGKATEEMRPSKRVAIPMLRVQSYAFPKLEIKVTCSSGTYVRALADDIGRALGTGAYLTQLRRTHIGMWDVANATPIESIAAGHVPLLIDTLLVSSL